MAKNWQRSEPEQAEYCSGQAGPDLIINTARVDANLPTIKYALEFGAHTDKASVSTMLDPTFMKVADRYNNVWGGVLLLRHDPEQAHG